jgi:Capsule polysaccharide biosynthesis protein
VIGMGNLTRSDWFAMSPSELDQMAWQAICDWPVGASVDVMRSGLNYAELTRCFLWDKVARAIRSQLNPAEFSFEAALLARPITPLKSPPPLPLTARIKQPLRNFYDRSKFVALKPYASWRNWPVLYVPCLHPQLRSIVATLGQASGLVVATPYPYAHAYRIRIPHQPLADPGFAYAEQLHQGILQGLQQWEITLLAQDVALLRQQIRQQMCDVQRYEIELAAAKPNAILVFADNHHPAQAYVLLAQRAGIPAIMLQHGLDCEHYCLEQAYADVIAVWGVARQQRYQQNSTYQPRIAVTGHPAYDHLRPPAQLDQTGHYWLWVTRPHGAEKCYMPSRSPQEGVDILDALLVALQATPTARLVIKPHPLENLELYQQRISQAQLGDRVAISSASLPELLPAARLVITEDSTAGLDAMFRGKVLIHAHFAPSPPVMPFGQYGAAFAATSAALLQTALQQAQHLTQTQANRLLQGQHQFLKDYVGVCDGQATQRVATLVYDVSSQSQLEPVGDESVDPNSSASFRQFSDD